MIWVSVVRCKLTCVGYEWEERRVDVKGKGYLTCYLLNSKHHHNPVVEKDDDRAPLVFADLSEE